MKINMQRSRLPSFLQRLGLPHILGLLTIFLLIIILFPKPVTLSFVVAKNETESWKPLIEQFVNKNPNIRIDLANYSNSIPVNPEGTDQLKEAYIAAFKGEGKIQPYDLIYMDIIWVPEFAAEDRLLDLSSEFPPEDLKKEFLVSEVDNGFYNGKLYRIPFRTDVGVLYYRKDLLEGLDNKKLETFEDLIRISQTLQSQKNVEFGYLWQGRRSEGLVAMFVEVLEGYGGFWIKPENYQVGLDAEEAIQAVNFLRETIDKGISPPGITTYEEETTRRSFRDGKAVFMRNWPNVWVEANGANSSISGNIAIQPMVHSEGKKSGACKGGWGFGIAKTTKHKKEAVQAIKFFTSATAQRQFTLSYGGVPSRRKLFLDPKIVAKYSHYPSLLNMIDNYWVARPRIPQYEEASLILQKYLSAALKQPNEDGYIRTQEAMDRAAQETRQLLATRNFNDKV
jgi:multiple sugar transport system substrate-binding protein